jgi:hypothetical protein
MIDNLRKRYEQLQGLLNTPMNQGGGLLGNIPQGALLGSAIFGQGLQGRDPFSALLPAAMQTAQLQKYMTPKDKRTSLMKNLEGAGYVPGTPEYENALKLRTLPEGAAPYSGFAKLANRDKAKGSAEYAVEGIDLLTNVANIGNRSPEVFGIGGAVKGFGKALSTEVRDIYQTTTGKSGDIDSKVFETLGSPDFSGIGAIENAVSIHVARNRNPEGRLLKDMITDAKEDASLQGLGGISKVKEKLPFLLQEFVSTAKTRYKQAGLNDEEINKILAPKIVEFEKALLGSEEQTKTTPKKQPGLIFDKKKNMYIVK